MKIAILLGEVTGRGGMETVISNVVHEYNANTNGNMKVFLLGGSEDETWLQQMNKEHYHIVSSADERKLNRYVKCVIKAPSELKKYDPDILVAADEKAVVYSKLIGKFLRKRPKVASWIHFSLTSIKPMYKKFIKSADFHLAISEGLKKEFIEFGISEEPKVHLVYNPLKINNRIMERPNHTTHFVYVGRLIYDGQKRVNDLLDALSNIQGDWKLTVIGDGKDKDKLVEMAKDLGINQHISWLGWKERPWETIKDASALLLTSEYEGFPMVLLEAMSRGIPCISSDCPTGPANIIKHDYNGWLYPVGEVEALSRLVEKIVNKQEILPSPSQVKQSVEKFDAKVFIKRIGKVFENEIYN